MSKEEQWAGYAVREFSSSSVVLRWSFLHSIYNSLAETENNNSSEKKKKVLFFLFLFLHFKSGVSCFIVYFYSKVCISHASVQG